MGTLYFCIQVSVDNYRSPETNFFTSVFFISDEKFKVKYIWIAWYSSNYLFIVDFKNYTYFFLEYRYKNDTDVIISF